MSNRVRRSKPSPLQAASIERRRGVGDEVHPRRTAWVIAGVAVALVAVVAAALIAASRSGSEAAVEPIPEAVTYGCTSCHSVDGSRREGPTWKGLAGSEVTLEDGRTVVADEAYIRRSIQDPRAEIVAGYTGSVMPQRPIPPADLDRLVAFVQELGGG